VNGKAHNPAPKWTPEVESKEPPIALAMDPKQDLEVAHKRLLALYKQMEALKLHTPEELSERKESAKKAMENSDLNSLTDLFAAWSQECKERQRK
jgi:hypothetical protein